MFKKTILIATLPILLILPFSLWAQDITKEDMKLYFESETMCYEYDVMDVPKMASLVLKSDSLEQLLLNIQDQANITPENELGELETEYNRTLSKYEAEQDKLFYAHIDHCKKLLNQSGMNITWERILSIREMINTNNQEVIKLQDEILLEEFNSRLNATESIIKGMDNDTFQHHLSYNVKLNRRQQEIQKASDAAIRGEGSEREVFKMRTELADDYQALIDDGTINEEHFSLLVQKINSDFMLNKFVEVLISGRIGFTK
jgi:vacuolar-type H+-ATPase subunit I/STV1